MAQATTGQPATHYIFPLAPITELAAINEMLRIIGEPPVNSVSDPDVTEAAIARHLLHNASREIQSLGLDCNSEEHYKLYPDDDGNIFITSNVIKADATNPNRNVTFRGLKAYDKDNNTYTFTETYLECDIVWFLAWDQLPQHVRQYIMVKAGRQFIVRMEGAGDLYKMTEKDEEEARQAFVSAEMENGDYNILNSYSAYRVIDRLNNPRRVK